MMKEIEAQIVEETGLRCCICLEGYKNQPNKVCVVCMIPCSVWGVHLFHKVLGIYTYTRKVTLDEFENKPRKAMVWFWVMDVMIWCDSGATISRVTALCLISMWCTLSAIQLLSSKNQYLCLLVFVWSVKSPQYILHYFFERTMLFSLDVSTILYVLFSLDVSTILMCCSRWMCLPFYMCCSRWMCLPFQCAAFICHVFRWDNVVVVVSLQVGSKQRWVGKCYAPECQH